MDFARAIEINRIALVRIVAAIFAMVGLVAGGRVERLPGAVRRAALTLLRPAESALRRLIAVAAHGLQVTPAAPRAPPAGVKISGKGAGARRGAAFQLFDPRKAFDRSGRRRGAAGPPPRISAFGFDPRVPLFQATPAPPVADAPVGGAMSERGLGRRLAAIDKALGDLARQARRLARWRARRALMPAAKFTEPLRPGAPPGHRNPPGHEVDDILRECHALARDRRAADTS